MLKKNLETQKKTRKKNLEILQKTSEVGKSKGFSLLRGQVRLVKMKGYQFLKNDFFDICRVRKIAKLPMLLLIYLRGLYAYYGKPTFFYKDESIMKDIGITRNTLKDARKKLQEKGVLYFLTFSGRHKATRYMILETDLAPEIKVSKFDRKVSKTDTFLEHKKYQKLTPSINREIKPVEYSISKRRKFGTTAQELLDKYKKEQRITLVP